MSGFQIFAADAAFQNRAPRNFFTHPTKKMPYHSQIFARKPEQVVHEPGKPVVPGLEGGAVKVHVMPSPANLVAHEQPKPSDSWTVLELHVVQSVNAVEPANTTMADD